MASYVCFPNNTGETSKITPWIRAALGVISSGFLLHILCSDVVHVFAHNEVLCEGWKSFAVVREQTQACLPSETNPCINYSLS